MTIVINGRVINGRACLAHFFTLGLVILIAACSGGDEKTPPSIQEEIIITETVLPEEIIPDPGITVQVQVGQEAVLDGSGSTTLGGQSLAYVWSFSHRPDASNAVLLDANTVAPRFVADVRGTYMVKLIVQVADVSSSPVFASVEAINEFSSPIPWPDHTTSVAIKFDKPCASCHVGGPGELIGKSPLHIASSDLCQACHSIMAFNPVAYVDHELVTGVCSSCHNGVTALGKSSLHVETAAECNECHLLTTSFLLLEADGSYNHDNISSGCVRCHNSNLAIGKDDDHLLTSSDCVNCHSTTAFKPATFDHTNYANDCARSGCHTGAPNAPGQPTGHPDTNAVNIDCNVCHTIKTFVLGNVFDHTVVISSQLACTSCHEGIDAVAVGKITNHIVTSADCGSCHNTTGFIPAFIDHASEAVTGTVKKPIRCDSCHNNTNAPGLPLAPLSHMPITGPEDCGDRCHTPGTFTSGVFDHMEAGVVISANCASCHNDAISIGKSVNHIPTSEDCSVCHLTDKFVGVVFSHAGIDANNCALCHNGTISTGKAPVVHIPTQDNCAVCHSTNAFEPSIFLTDVHVNITQGCEGCHNGQFTTANVTVADKPLTHLPTNQDCDSCHTVAMFIPSTFAHVGINNNCSSCHNGSYVTIGALATPNTAIHTDAVTAGTDCVACHNTKLFKPAFVDHSTALVTGVTCVSCHNGTIATGKVDKVGGVHVQTSHDCDVCHVPGGSFAPAVFDHSNLPGSTACDSCHGVSATGKDAKTNPGHITTTEDCAVCHNTTAFAGAKFDHRGVTTNCSSCHGDTASGKSNVHIPTSDDCSVCHVTTGFLPSTFAHVGIVNNCQSCHDGFYSRGKSIAHVVTTEDCASCHNTSSFIGAVYDHAGIVDNCARSGCHGDGAIGQEAKTNPAHIPTALDCVVCHGVGFTTFSGGVFHANVVVTNNCGSCHDGVLTIGKMKTSHIPVLDDCSVCHTVNGFEPSIFLTDVHVNITQGCEGCHNGQFTTANVTVADKPLTHLPTNQDCDSCHTVAMFIPSTFAHVGINNNCSSCHNGSYVTIGALATPNTAIHTDAVTAGTDCVACHNTKLFKPAFVDHSTALVTGVTCVSCHNGTIATGKVDKVGGVHVQTSQDCDVCHVPGGSFAPAIFDHSNLPSDTRCDSCHGVSATGKDTKTDPAHIATIDDCAVCHNTTAFAGAKFDHRGVTTNCSSCHGDTASGKSTNHIPTSDDCSDCHVTTGFLPASFEHVGIVNNCQSCHDGLRAKGKSNNHFATSEDCSVCHNTNTFVGAVYDHAGVVDNCASCHDGIITTGKSTTTHIPTSDDCSVCHNISAFKPSNFLADLHLNISLGCVDCHNGLYSTPSVVVSGKSPNHIPTSNLCETCHTKTTFALVALVDHQQVFGVCSDCHNGVLAIGKSDLHVPTSGECNDCHNNTSDFLSVQLDGSYDHTNISSGCGQCHNAVLAIGKDVGHVDTGSECNACHTTTAFLPASVDHTNFTDNCARSGCHTGAPNALGQPDGHPDTNAINVDCSICHNTTSFFMGNVFNHALISSGELACQACHDGIAAVARVKLTTHLDTAADCGSCHTTISFVPDIIDHDSEAVTGTVANPIRCDSCHNNTGAIGLPLPPATHMPITAPEDCGDRCHTPGTFTSGVFDHKEAGVLIDANCTSCHNEIITIGKPINHLPTVEDCSVCHLTDRFTGVVFNHAGIDINNCALCHDGSISTGKDFNHLPTTENCALCHGTGYVSFVAATFHSNVLVIDGCATCHDSVIATGKPALVHIPTQDECNVCHTVNAFEPSTFLNDVHVNIIQGCEGCHNGQFTTPNVTVADKPTTHLPTGQDCDNCHTVAAFIPSTFAHVGINSNCDTCHNGNYAVIGARGAPDTAIHTSAVVAGNDCVACHNTKLFKPAFVDHSSTLVTGVTCMSCHDGTIATGKADKPVGLHVPTSQDCDICHVPGGSFLPAVFDHNNLPKNTQCDSCHGVTATGKDAKTNPGHIATIDDCSVCHNTTAFAGAKFDHRGTTTNCASCHGDTAVGKPTYHVPTVDDCSVCHVTTGFLPATFDHVGIVDNCQSCHDGFFARGKSITHAPTAEDCGVCHNTRTFLGAVYDHTGIIDNCAQAGCHGDGATGMDAKTNPAHIPTTLDCSACHTTGSFLGGIWDHGNNSAGRCLDCHIVDGGATPQPTQGHFITGPTVQCDACHTTLSWAPASAFVHCPNSKTSTCTTSNYPGDHKPRVGCINCHTNNSQVIDYTYPQYAPFCAGCHADDFRPESDHNGGSAGTIEQNKDCGGSGCHHTNEDTFT